MSLLLASFRAAFEALPDSNERSQAHFPRFDHSQSHLCSRVSEIGRLTEDPTKHVSGLTDDASDQRGVDELPNTGAPKELRDAAGEDLLAVADILAQDDFFKRKADLNTRKTTIEARVAEAVAAMHAAQAERLLAAESELALIPEWSEFTAEEQAGTLGKIQALSVEVMPDIAGVQKLVARQFDIEGTIAETKAKVVQEGKARRQQVLYPKTSNTPVQGVHEKRKKTITIPARIGTPAELDALIRTLSDLRRELLDIDLDFVVQEN